MQIRMTIIRITMNMRIKKSTTAWRAQIMMKLLVRKIMIETLKDNTYSESDPEVEVEVAALSAANLVQFDIFVLSLMISMIVSTKKCLIWTALYFVSDKVLQNVAWRTSHLIILFMLKACLHIRGIDTHSPSVSFESGLPLIISSFSKEISLVGRVRSDKLRLSKERLGNVRN